MLGLRLRKSRGVRVTLWVHGQIVRGNRARDNRDWSAAAAAYTAALRRDPALSHIWVQLGHALKEQSLFAEAADAYRRAMHLDPTDADPHLHLGHLAHRAQDLRQAGQHYTAAFRADPAHADSPFALQRAVALARGSTRAALLDAIRTTLGDEPDPVASAETTGGGLTFDVSDLVRYYMISRLPTGIQRVQIQTITSAIESGTDVRLCCFIDGRDDWLEIPVPGFTALMKMSVASGDRTDPAWTLAVKRMQLRLMLARPLVFPYGATLVNLGSSWQLYNYFLFVREAKTTRGIRYVPFIHDLIPIVQPEHFIRAAKLEVVPWVLSLFDHADQFLANSEATKRDLLQVASVLGHTVDPADVAVIPLDADFRRPGAAELPVMALDRWSLRTDGFVLFVATVESRKGHKDALEAWVRLMARHGPDRVPMLVLVGKKGWLAEHVYLRLEQDPSLAAKVMMLSGLSDAELALLYRTCMFTLYPSLYEGWGLPVTESLCYGKPVITTDSSSLPESGGPFAIYVPPGNPAALAAAAERLIFEPEHRAAVGARILAGFQPRSWTDIAGQIQDALADGAARHPSGRPAPRPMVRMGEYHPLGRPVAPRIWPGAATGEAFRVGTGWRAPGHEGTWTRPMGGELAIGLPTGQASLQLGLLLIGSHEREVEWRVQVQGGPGRGGVLGRSRSKWVLLDCPASPDRTLRLRLRALPAEPNQADPDDDEATIGLAGFYVHSLDDAAANVRLREAITLGNLDDVDAYRDPSLENGGPATGWEADAGSPLAAPVS